MTDLHAEDESFLETHARWPCAQLFASCPKSGILFLFARVLFFWPTTIPIIVSAHVADVAPHGCLDALKAWHFPSPDDVTTIVLLPYLPTAQSRTCTRLQDRFRAVNRTATECTLGVNRPAPGRVIEFTLGYVNVDGAMDGLNSMACVPRHECTDEEDIGAALVQLIPYATHARVQFLAEGCEVSPLLCTPERLKVVRMGDLNTASYNRLVRWASNGKATVPFAPDINARYNPSPNTSRWIVRDGTRYPSEVSYEVHQVLRNSFASEYVDIEPWLSAYAP
eukprot:GEMP01064347.1.p1 GENE.GEMP01064347.1~~GEMP01064347.1.p1  ORF type:complete len:280 (+),score=50.79 GEMP01064347.1:133-972(+)